MFLPSATVLTITPKPLCLIDCTSFLSRSFSCFDSIFCETETRSEKGTKTKNRPANESSQLILGPFVEIGSLTTCTNIDWLALSMSATAPSLSISFSNWKFFREKSFSLPALTSFMNFK